MYLRTSGGFIEQILWLVVGFMALIMSIAVFVLAVLLGVGMVMAGRFARRKYHHLTRIEFAHVRPFNAPQASRLEDAFDYWFFQIWEATGINFTSSIGGLFLGSLMICGLAGLLTAGVEFIATQTFDQWIWHAGAILGVLVGLHMTRSTRLWFSPPPPQFVSNRKTQERPRLPKNPQPGLRQPPTQKLFGRWPFKR